MKKIFMLMAAAALTACASKTKNDQPTAPTLPGWTWECHDGTSVKGLDYCEYTQGTPKQTLFYFHGLGCNQDILQSKNCVSFLKPEDFEAKFMAGLKDVRVITISWGYAWLLDPISPKTMADKDATVLNVKTKVIPEIAKAYALPKPWKAVGHSMGGFNVAELCTSDAVGAETLFSKCVMVHPMLITADPYAKEWADCLSLKSLLLSGKILPKPECLAGPAFIAQEFPKSKWPTANPINRAKTAQVIPPTTVLICTKDDFNLIDGPKAFVTNASARGLPVSAVVYSNCTHYLPDADLVLQSLEM